MGSSLDVPFGNRDLESDGSTLPETTLQGKHYLSRRTPRVPTSLSPVLQINSRPDLNRSPTRRSLFFCDNFSERKDHLFYEGWWADGPRVRSGVLCLPMDEVGRTTLGSGSGGSWDRRTPRVKEPRVLLVLPSPLVPFLRCDHTNTLPGKPLLPDGNGRIRSRFLSPNTNPRPSQSLPSSFLLEDS